MFILVKHSIFSTEVSPSAKQAGSAVQGGGASARTAAQAAGLLPAGAPALRMRPAPALAGPAPVFVPSDALPAGRRAGPGGQLGARAQARNPGRPPRLQHDDPFEIGLQELAVT